MSNDINEKNSILVDRLYKQTKSGKIDWRMNSFSNEPEVKLKDVTLTLRGGNNANGAPLEIVVLEDGLGGLIDSFNDEDLAGQPMGISGFNDYFSAMKAMRQNALRQASGANKVVDDLINFLSDEDS
ncbi:hypothetical protein [Sphingomonas sp. PB4P5]|uniref:hypothetical protein n=1 Tax=Parasphingomonas puruogangriensis TaxID=3096155 RepID=UPI002FC9900F